MGEENDLEFVYEDADEFSAEIAGIYMSLVLRKPVFGVSDQVRHKPGCTVTEARVLKFRI